jgi:hypothetical protein
MTNIVTTFVSNSVEACPEVLNLKYVVFGKTLHDRYTRYFLVFCKELILMMMTTTPMTTTKQQS